MEEIHGLVKKKAPKVARLPYDGPELCFLRITHEVPLHARSTVVIEKKCEVCKRISYTSNDKVLKGRRALNEQCLVLSRSEESFADESIRQLDC